MNGVLKREVSRSTVVGYWWLSLGAGLGVIGAVSFLLSRLLRTVIEIQLTSERIWQVGKLIANNTVHVPLLGRTNQILDEVLEATQGVAGATERIEEATANFARGEG